MNNSPDEITRGKQALARAQWRTARDAFQNALAGDDTPEAQDGLGIALWWLNDIRASHEHRTLAYNAYKKRGDVCTAARLAAWLAREQVFFQGNVSSMNGWFARAERLLEQAGPCAEWGWFLLWRASMVASPPELERAAQAAIGLAREHADADLEFFARALLGQARVMQGHVQDGMNHLDEAMAAALGGEVPDRMVVSEIYCFMLSTCELAGDLVRTEHWCLAAENYARRHECTFLGAYCRTTYGGLLAATGRWQQAETELKSALEIFEHGHRGLRAPAVIRLADLRISQGRLEEAQVLLRGYEDHGEALAPRARLHLAYGETPLARALIEQALRNVETLMLAHAPLLLLLVQIALAMRDTARAAQAVMLLGQLAAAAPSDFLDAQIEMARGAIARQTDPAAAIEHFQTALRSLHAYDQSLPAGRVKLELARALKERDPAAALVWAQTALAAFERMGAQQDADAARQLLRELGAPRRTTAQASDTLTPREAQVLELVALGASNREIAERLVISPKTVEHHVSQILSKLQLKSRAEAAAYAARRGAPDGAAKNRGSA